MADPLTPAMPAMAGLLRQAQPCYCQPTDGFVAIPGTGTFLVRDGRAATVPEPDVPPFGGLLHVVDRGVTAPNGRRLDHTARVGHSAAAHRAHGWCAVCPGIEPDAELVAWRARDNALHAAGDPVQALEPDSCPGPRAEEVTPHGR